MTENASELEKAGLAILEQIGWSQNERVKELDEDLWRIISETNFGAIWARPGLSLRDRELICMAILIARGSSGVALHFKSAHHVGLTEGELKEVVLQCIPYAGLPRALSAMRALKRTMRGEEPEL